MNCPACSHENRAGAKFCKECGAPIKHQCASCGAELEPSAKFCDECGLPTGAGGPPPARPIEAFGEPGARKVVSVVFADLVGSTGLHERVDAESARRLMERYYETLRSAVDEHGGTVVKLLGDGVMAAFGVPQVAEDDAIRAVRSAVAMQDAFRALVGERATALAEVGLRVAVNTGEVVVSGSNDDVVGDPVNIAARLQQEAGDGDVVIGEATRRLVASLVTLEPLGSFGLKGRLEAVGAYRVVSLERPAGASATPFVGREAELARVTAVYEAAIAEPAARLAVLVGSPGLGKSRLIEELGRRLGDNANVIDAHCDPAGGATFSPLADALREFLDIDAGVAGDALSSAIESRLPDDESDRTRIANGIASLLAGAPASPEETFFVVRRLLASFAANKPLLLVIDDVQWAEPLFLDLVEHLVQWGDGVPLVLLAGGRPELRDLRSSFVTVGGLVADVITLDGLDAGAATRLAAHVIGASDLPAAVAAKVLATSEGNPLFVGELVRMLVHEGILTRADDRWIVSEGLASFEMPPTIHALLAARIERLQPEDRTILERAAVIGRQFSRGAVAELLPHGAAGLDARLEALGRAELIDRDAGWFLGEPVLRFHHVLIRDAAYRRLLKETRAELHARFADWIERRAADSFEHDETIGWHLEQAHQLLAELGPLDESGHTLGGRAAQRLSAAGRRALARDDVSLAANLLQRALGCLHGADPGRADLALDGCEALLAAGEVGRAVAVIDELDRLAASSDRLRAWHTCFVGQLTALTAPEELHSTADAVAGAAAQLARLGDTAGEAKAHFVHAQALARLGKVGACEAALDRALAAARSAGDRRRANAVLAGAPLAALWGPSPVTRASGRCLDVVRVLRITQGAPAVESVALSCQGVLEALRGRTDAARRMIASSRKMVEELGITHRLFEADVFAARIDLLEGDTVAAERGLRGAYEGLRDLGLGIDAARAAALLARTVLAEGRVAEAETLSHESEALAGDDLQAAIAWRGVRAEALAQRGEIDGAIDLARAAVQIAASTDALLDHADARLALAAALRAAGRSGEANLEEQRALDLWETKGATLLAERARGDAASADVRPTTSAPSLAAPGATAATGATGVAGAPAATRAVRPNSATVLCERLVAAINARDAAAFDALLSDDHVLVHHTTGVTSGKRENIARWTAAFRAGQLPCRGEIVAALGFDLALVRASTVVSGLEGGDFAAFGPTEFQEVLIAETDGSDGISRVEVFAADRLGEAVARFYQRYAERLPEGQARDHAVTTAHAVLGMFTVSPEYQVDDVMMPDVEIVDHRLVGYGTLLTRQKASAWSAATEELAQDRTIRIDEVLGLSADALLRRTTVSGKLRASGGAFESSFYSLSAFGQDGRITRQELFDVDDRAGALARFDDVATQTVEPPSKLRRLRPNAASAKMAALEAAFRARDLDAVDALCGESLETVDHPAGATYGREGQLESARRMMRLADLEFRLEVLATLTDSMCLCRRRISATGTSGGSFDVAEYEMEHIVLAEIDEVGRSRRYEIFAPDHLSVAVGRFYERYAELLPGGLDRDRAEVTARAMSAYVDASDVDRWAPLVAPDVASVDHRVLGTWSARSWKELRAHFDSLFALASGVEFRVDDVLALSPEALLVRTMNSGITLASGGAYERPFLLLAVCGSDGLVKNSEYFDLGCEAEALARFDELVGGGDEAGASGARSSRFDNTAVELQERTVACFGARDWARLTELLDPNFRCSDRRHMARLDIDRDDFIGMSRALGDMDTVSLESDIVATRGDRLLLYRARIEVADGDVGPSDLEHLNIAETNERGDRFVAVVRFDADDLEAAYAELEARYAAGEGAEYPVALAYLVEFQRAFKSRDWDAMARLGSSDQVAQNHRLVGWGSIEGSDVWVRPLQELVALAPDVRMRANHLRLSELGTLVQLTWSGTQDGGAFETPIVIVTELGEDGRHRRMDVWDADAVDTAFARFGEINSPTRSRGLPFANSAFEVMRESIAAWSRRDERGFWEPHASTFRYRDHRRQFQLDLDHEEFVEFTRPILAMAVSASLPLIATRGEHLVLVRLCAEVAEEPVGPSEIDSLFVVETNERREIVGYDRYDLDDLDAAYAQLDALWEAGEAAVHRQASSWVAATRRTFECRDWGAMAQTGADDQVATNHRFVGWGTLQGAAAWVPPLQELVTLAPDVRMRSDHVRTSLRAALWKYSWYGTREGGAFEIPCVLVAELNEDGRHRRFDVWDGDALDAAFARFEELSASVIPSSSLRFENAATRTLDRASEAMRANDWARCVALLAPEFRCLGRRKMLRFDADRDEFLAGIRPWFDMNQSQVEAQVVATRGGRCALVRWSSRGESGDVGPSEIELLVVVEVNENGDATRMVTFGCDQVEAGYAELDARYSEGGGAEREGAAGDTRRLLEAMNHRDWDAIRAICASGFRVEDCRLLGWGPTLRDVDTLIDSQRALFELSPDARYRLDHLRVCGLVYLFWVTRIGTREGGAHEAAMLTVGQWDETGKLKGYEIYDPEQIDEAFARFEERTANAVPCSLAVIARPTAATAAMDRWHAAFKVGHESGDWDALRRICAPAMVFEDRRRMSLLSGDVELMIASAGERESMGALPETWLLSTGGDRVGLWRMMWSGGPPDGRFEIEYLALMEVDESGQLVAILLIDVDDARAAQQEVWNRWAAVDPVAKPWIEVVATKTDAFNDHDLSPTRRIFVEDIVVEDHRRTGIGRIEGIEEYLRAISVLWELSPDMQAEFGQHWLALDRSAAVSTIRRSGNVAGGGAFESEYLIVDAMAEGLVTRMEFFELEALNAALARFEELRHDPLRIPPNAATRAFDRSAAAALSRDWSTLRSLISDDFVFEDRGKRSLVRGGAEELLPGLQYFVSEVGATCSFEPLATAGDRLAMHHNAWRNACDTSTFEIDKICITEIDASGKACTMILFDTEDRAAASAELLERGLANGAGGLPRASGEYLRAFNAHDLDGVRAVLPDDYYHHDHRRTGIGRIDGADVYLESLKALFDLSPDVRLEPLYQLPPSKQGLLMVNRWIGTDAEGGEFESLFAALTVYRGSDIAGIEIFEIENLDLAIARFERLHGSSTADPLAAIARPNAATVTMERMWAAFGAEDLDAARALSSPDLVWEDRRPMVGMSGDRELMLASARERLASGARPEHLQIVGTAGDRVAVARVLWAGGPTDGRFEVEFLLVIEVDEAGLCTATIFFDIDEKRAALREAWARWVAIDPTVKPWVDGISTATDAFNAYDLTQLRTAWAEDLVVHDHRRTGIGMIEGRNAYCESLTALWELSPDTQFDNGCHWPAWNRTGAIVTSRRTGTVPDGGPYETDWLTLSIMERGLVTRLEFFEIDDLDTALTRFEELSAVNDATNRTA